MDIQTDSGKLKKSKRIGMSGRESFRKFKNSYQLVILFIPCFIYYVMFVYIPMYGISISFMDFRPFRGFAGSNWVGLKHYARFFTDSYSLTLVRNTFLLSFYDLIFGFTLTIVFALLVNEIRFTKVKRTFQTITYLPHFISVVVVVGMLKSFLNPDGGMLFSVLQLFGMPRTDIFIHAQYFRTLYVSSGIWQSIGWNAIIYYAAMAGIDPELYEAAAIDGATRFQRAIHVTLACIKPTIIILLILRMGSILTVGFDKAYLMQTVTTTSVSEILNTFVYSQGIAGNQMSYASAVGVFNSVINCLFLLAANFIAKKTTERSLF